MIWHSRTNPRRDKIMSTMLSERAQMSQDLSGWNLKFLNVSLSEEREQVCLKKGNQSAHDMFQSLSWKRRLTKIHLKIHINSFLKKKKKGFFENWCQNIGSEKMQEIRANWISLYTIAHVNKAARQPHAVEMDIVRVIVGYMVLKNQC